MRRILILLAFAVAALAQPVPSTPCYRSGSATSGQVLTSTGGNNCQFENAATGGTGNAADPETYTPGASVTLTCASASANTVTTFTPSAALAANMAVTFASCTPGQLVVLKVTQAASGGPYTVSGLPTGAPQISTYPSAGTVYQMTAVTSSTMAFVGVATNAGSTSLGSGANGISKTVTAGTSGVTVNLLASSDASNPTAYNTSGIGGCGSGVAAYSATSGNTFELYTVPGTTLTMVADGTITAGHLVTGGANTGGRVADTGQTARTSVPIGTCLVGRALQSQTVGNTLLVAYDGASAAGELAASATASVTVNGATCTLGSSCNGNWVSGSVTSGHLAAFTGTGGELIDNGALAANQILFGASSGGGMSQSAGLAWNGSTLTVNGNFLIPSSPIFSPTTTNQNLNLSLEPSGTNTQTGFTLYNNASAGSAQYAQFVLVGPGSAAAFRISTGANTGSAGPIVFQPGGTTWMELYLSGGLYLGSSPSDPGAGSATLSGTLKSPSVISSGTKFAISGCSAGTTVGGATAGTFASGTTGTCTVTITLPTSTTGWVCVANDETTPANLIAQTTGGSSSTCVITGTTVSGDVISFFAIGF